MEVRDPGRARRTIIIAALVAAALQVALAPQLAILGGRINFMLAFAGAVALGGDSSAAVYAGFFGGLFYDLTAAVPVGLMALIMTIGSFLLAAAAGGAGGGLSSRSMQFVFCYALGACLLNGLVLFFMGSEGSILIALFGHGLVSAVLTTIASACFLFFLGRSEGSGPGFSARGHKGARRARGSRYKGLR